MPPGAEVFLGWVFHSTHRAQGSHSAVALSCSLTSDPGGCLLLCLPCPFVLLQSPCVLASRVFLFRFLLNVISAGRNPVFIKCSVVTYAIYITYISVLHVRCLCVCVYPYTYKHTHACTDIHISLSPVSVSTHAILYSHIPSCSTELCNRSALETVVAGYPEDKLHTKFLRQFRPFSGSFSK